ncbi:YkuD domain-containing protein [Corynebacterium kutscheri]|uniref:YkuD domain-containing protein n=2 Tax=Corynebacterium kutscheri TaxID=35755 RepID=A0A0F6R0Q5_9CORY|nr:YkuD domain-containing protein [Corynebacterium kutscheri]VEH10990.1 L,D-transpeptidase catalytic domain, region YkuD [Corynebacterium kutscheri]
MVSLVFTQSGYSNDMSYTVRSSKTAVRRRLSAMVATVATATAVLWGQATVASAEDLGSSNIKNSIEQQLANVDRSTRDGAWQLRMSLHAQADAGLSAEAAAVVKRNVDNVINLAFPGLIQQRSVPVVVPAPKPVEPAQPAFDTGLCPAHARACIDLAGQRSWLQENGQVSYGAVPISSGRVGYETPKGAFRVNRKIKDEISREFNNAPMPYSVYFTNNGIAFHEGSPQVASHGCIHLNHKDAVTFFNQLHIGDVVYVY